MDRNPITKALRVLSWLIQEPSGSAGVREVAVALGISPSSAHRLLAALVEEGFVRQDAESSRYSLGIELYRLANIAAAKAPIRRAALKHLQRLVDACNETALLGIYSDLRQEMMFAAQVESQHPLRYVIELNRWLPLHIGASGLAILAFLPPDRVQSLIERSRLAPAVTGTSVAEPYRLEMELEAIRERGYATSRHQPMPDAVGLAAPVFGPRGDVVGDVCLTIPEHRFDEAGERRLIELLRECASAIMQEIGGKRAERQAA